MRKMQKIRQAGADRAQSVIQIHAAGQAGCKVMSSRFSRAKALEPMSPRAQAINAMSWRCAESGAAPEGGCNAGVRLLCGEKRAPSRRAGRLCGKCGAESAAGPQSGAAGQVESTHSAARPRPRH